MDAGNHPENGRTTESDQPSSLGLPSVSSGDLERRNTPVLGKKWPPSEALPLSENARNVQPSVDLDHFRLAGFDIDDRNVGGSGKNEVASATDSAQATAAWQERVKSSQRLRYEAEAEFIRKKLGDLESIRKGLGLSQRKICQLLLVDPSAWTRWTRGQESAPPHIYRMLQWYLAVEEKYPVLDVNFWLSTVARVSDSEQADLTAINKEIVRLRQVAIQAEEKSKQDSSALTERFLGELRLQDQKARRQNWIVIAAAIGGSLIAGWFASIVL